MRLLRSVVTPRVRLGINDVINILSMWLRTVSLVPIIGVDLLLLVSRVVIYTVIQ